MVRMSGMSSGSRKALSWVIQRAGLLEAPMVQSLGPHLGCHWESQLDQRWGFQRGLLMEQHWAHQWEENWDCHLGLHLVSCWGLSWGVGWGWRLASHWVPQRASQLAQCWEQHWGLRWGQRWVFLWAQCLEQH